MSCYKMHPLYSPQGCTIKVGRVPSGADADAGRPEGVAVGSWITRT